MASTATKEPENSQGELIYDDSAHGITIRLGKDFVCARWRSTPILTVRIETGKPRVHELSTLPMDYRMAVVLNNAKQRALIEALRLEPMVHDRSKSFAFNR